VDGSEGQVLRKTYSTFRSQLTRMRGWLKLLKVTDIAMESTGVYWRAVWNVLEGQGFATLLLANPIQVKALAGRKSDARDCQRIAEFLQDRRLDPSFVPPPEIRELRQLLRHRLSLLQQRNEVHNHIRDLFETANLKFSSVASDLMGVSGRRIMEAMIAGVDSPELLSWRIRGRLCKKAQQVRESLKGCFQEFHRMLLESLYEQYRFLTSQIEQFEARLAEYMTPYAQQIAALVTIPGVDKVVAWTLMAELGPDMSVFPDAAHCASWAGLTPGNDESAGKQRSTACKKGNKFLRRVLAQAAWAASRCKKGYLRALFHRIKARRGWSKAIIAVAHKILVIAYTMLRDGTTYQDVGDDYFDKLNPLRTTRRLVHRLERLGFHVDLSKPDQLST
jgi:transposase